MAVQQGSGEELGSDASASLSDTVIIAAPEQPISHRIRELTDALANAHKIYCATGKSLLNRMLLWVGIVISIISIIVLFYYFIFDDYFYYLPWNWGVLYRIIIRSTQMIAIFTAFGVSFGILRSYIFMYEDNRHKQNILESMSSLVGSGTSQNQREIVYEKMIDLLIKMSDTKLLSSEKKVEDYSSLTNLIEKISKLKEL